MSAFVLYSHRMSFAPYRNLSQESLSLPDQTINVRRHTLRPGNFMGLEAELWAKAHSKLCFRLTKTFWFNTLNQNQKEMLRCRIFNTCLSMAKISKTPRREVKTEDR